MARVIGRSNRWMPAAWSIPGMFFFFLSVAAGAETPPAEPPGEGSPAVIRLLSTQQYQRAVADVLGKDISNSAKLPALFRIEGLAALGAATAAVTPGTLDVFDSAARSIAAQVVDPAHRKFLLPCKSEDPQQPDDTCVRAFFRDAGRLLFRRVLTSEELNRYVSIARSAGQQLQDNYAGVRTALATLLVAPEFIYLVEHSEPDATHPGEQRLDGPSKAMRLSLLLWDSPPDVELLRAAEAGELHTPRGLSRQVDRMLASARLEDGVRAFFADMLVADAFDELTKDPVIYPAFSGNVAADAREQMLRMIVDQLVVRGGDYRDLFTTRHIFLTSNLAPLYRIPLNAPPERWVPYELPESDPRAGLLTQVGFLSTEAHPGRSSATRRGKGIREILMCQKVPPPPGNVDIGSLDNPDPNLRTTRERLDAHRSNPVCAGCHKLTDPMGLSLENFDGAGQYRAMENGVAIDASGSHNRTNFSDAKGLGLAVRNDPAITSCVVQRLYQYGLGRPLNQGDRPLLAFFNDRFADAGYNFPALLRSFALSAAFFRVKDDLQSTTVQLQR